MLAFLMVDKRWAMINTVLPAMSRSRASCTRCSFSASRALPTRNGVRKQRRQSTHTTRSRASYHTRSCPRHFHCDQNYNGSCPYTSTIYFLYSKTIMARKPGTLDFHWPAVTEVESAGYGCCWAWWGLITNMIELKLEPSTLTGPVHCLPAVTVQPDPVTFTWKGGKQHFQLYHLEAQNSKFWVWEELDCTITHSTKICLPGCFIEEKNFGILKKEKHYF